MGGLGSFVSSRPKGGGEKKKIRQRGSLFSQGNGEGRRRQENSSPLAHDQVLGQEKLGQNKS